MLDKPSYEYVNKKVNDVKDKVGDTTTLQTTDKTSVVKAVNELFGSVSSGKQKVASAITDKGVSTAQDATFDQMATNIRSIQTGGTGITPSGTKIINDNGTYDVTTFASAEVNVPKGTEVSGTKTITSNGEHDVSSYEKANVNVPIPSGYIKPSGTKPITENGTHDVTNYASVEVDVASSGASTTGKIFRYTHPTRSTSSQWITLVPADADVLAHKDDTTLCVSFHNVTPPASNQAGLIGAVISASAMSADSKYGVAVRQTSAGAQSPTSIAKGLRDGTATSNAIHVTNDGAVRVYQSGSYPLNVGEFIIAVSW
jgi:hypothetical protein